jgi:hypothetical protein
MAAAFESVTCTLSSDYIYPTVNGNPNNFLIIDGDTLRITTQRTVNTSSDAGYAGEICYDSNYIYVCIADNTWRRVPLQSF